MNLHNITSRTIPCLTPQEATRRGMIGGITVREADGTMHPMVLMADFVTATISQAHSEGPRLVDYGRGHEIDTIEHVYDHLTLIEEDGRYAIVCHRKEAA